MRNRAGNKILSFALAAVIMLGVFAAPPMTAYATVDLAAPSGTHPAVNLAAGSVYYGGNLYRVVANDGTTMTLFMDGSLGAMAYDNSNQNKDWSGSEICLYLNNDTIGFLSTFTSAERAAIPDYGTTEVRNSEYPGISPANDIDISQQIMLPSYDEVRDSGGTWNMSQSDRGHSALWWLRSPGSNTYLAAVVNVNGSVIASGTGVTSDRAIRPAFKLNLASVIFTSSAASGGKSTATVGSGLVGASAPTQNLKFTVEDDEQSLEVIATTAQSTQTGSTLEFSYDDATIAADKQYISCFLDNNGAGDDYYGKLIKVTDASKANGTLSVRLSDVTAGTYTLKIFSEQANDNYYTDFCSTPVTMTVVVSGGSGTVSEFTGTEDNTAPTVSSVTPSGTGVSTSTANLVLTFSEKIDITTAGTVTMSPNVITNGAVTANDSRWNNPTNTMLTIPVSGLAYNTAYSINVSGFKDMAGNVMDAVTSGLTFTTEKESHSIAVDTMANGAVTIQSGLTQASEGTLINLTVTPENEYRLVTGSLKYNTTTITGTSFTMPDAPVTICAEFEPIPEEPSVSQTSLTVEVNDTAQFIVYLGKGADAADSATVSSDDESIATVNTAVVATSGVTVTVAGKSVGTAQISIGWSGGVKDGQTDTVDVEVVDATPATPTDHAINASAGSGGSIAPSGRVSVADGDDQIFAITANSGYYISRVTVDGVNQGAIGSYTFTNVTDNHTIYAEFARYNTTSRDRSSDSGGSSYTPTIAGPAIPSTLVVDAAKAKAALAEREKSGAGKARIRYNGEIKVLAESWPVFGNIPVDFDMLDENGVQVRVTVREPGKMTGDKLLSGYVKGSIVDSRKAFFEKWYKNKVRVIHFDQQGNFGQPDGARLAVEIAAKVDLTGMDTANLYFYSYDKAANTYRRIEKPAYWIDKNGYLHFTTEYAGDIVVSEGHLERK